jgi:hypothetical protein
LATERTDQPILLRLQDVAAGIDLLTEGLEIKENLKLRLAQSER